MVLRSVLSTRYPHVANDGFASFERALQRSLNDAWHDMPAHNDGKGKSLSVKMDVFENENAFIVTADLPGLSEKEVELSFDEGLLTLRGERKVEREEKKETSWHVAERSSGSFVRKLQVKAPIDAAKIEAKFEKGVLTVTLPKQPQEPATTRKIEIKSI